MIRVVQPGFFTTVQDDGRWGHQRFGVPVAGPMDWISHRLANLIVGNRPSCATLEVTVAGPGLEFSGDAIIAVAGAEFELSLDGMRISMNTAHGVRVGQCLRFGQLRKGVRSYISVAGGLDLPVVFGSRATHITSGHGGFKGRPLKTGDQLKIGTEVERSVSIGREWPGVTHLADHGARIRIILGPHEDCFGPQGVEVLETSRYEVTTNSDRMGYRLAGPRLEFTDTDILISSPVPAGSIQVPPAGEPIILMADRQTTGGYPRIGTVITADIAVVAQLLPSDWIEFETCDQAVALRALVEQERTLMSYL